MGFQEFTRYYLAAREKYHLQPIEIATRIAMEAFLLDLYAKLGLEFLYPKDMLVHVYELYAGYRSLKYSRDKAWLLCERTIINTIQQEIIEAKQRRGYSKHEAYELCKLFMRKQRGKCPVFDQYNNILTPETPDDGSDYRSTYTEQRRPDYTTDNTFPFGYSKPRRSSTNRRAPPVRPDPFGRPQYHYGPREARDAAPNRQDTFSESQNPPPRSFNTAGHEYRRPSPPSSSGFRYESGTNGTQPSPSSRYPYGTYPTSGYTRSPPASEYTRPPKHTHPSSSSYYTPPSPPPEGIKPPTCLYRVLGILRSATADDIKKAHRKLMLKWHPDRNHGKEAEATAQTKVINEARDVLMDGEARAFYDRTGCLP